MPTFPAIDDRNAVFRFAMSFKGYEYYGSFEACAGVAARRPRDSLASLRAELFMAARASNHRQDDQFLEIYQEILPLLMGHWTDNG